MDLARLLQYGNGGQFETYGTSLSSWIQPCKQQREFTRRETYLVDTVLDSPHLADNVILGHMGFPVKYDNFKLETQELNKVSVENEEESRIAMEVIKAFTTSDKSRKFLEVEVTRFPQNKHLEHSPVSRHQNEWNFSRSSNSPPSSRQQFGDGFIAVANGISSHESNNQSHSMPPTQQSSHSSPPTQHNNNQLHGVSPSQHNHIQSHSVPLTQLTSHSLPPTHHSFHFYENNTNLDTINENYQVIGFPKNVSLNRRESLSLLSEDSISYQLLTPSNNPTRCVIPQHEMTDALLTSSADNTAGKSQYFTTSDVTVVECQIEPSSLNQRELKLNSPMSTTDYTNQLIHRNDSFCDLDKIRVLPFKSVLSQKEDNSDVHDLDNCADPFPDIEPSIGFLHPSYDVVGALTTQWAESQIENSATYNSLHGHRRTEATSTPSSATSSAKDEINTGKVRTKRKLQLRSLRKTLKLKTPRANIEGNPHHKRKNYRKKNPRIAQESIKLSSGSSPLSALAGHQLPPCRICGDKASGIHFGVNSCEACNEFFRRTLKYGKVYKCARNKNCDVSGSRRNICPYCRYQRCVDSGMSRNRIKTGRYSQTKKTMDALEIETMEKARQYNGEAGQMEGIVQTLQELFDEFRHLEVDFEDDVLARKQLSFYRAYRERKLLGGNVKCSCLDTSDQSTTSSQVSSISTPLLVARDQNTENSGPTRFADNPKEAVRTSENLANKKRGTDIRVGLPGKCLTQTEFCRRVIIKHGNAREFIRVSMQQWEQWIIDFIRLVKQIPGFSNLDLADQMTLLKTSICQWYILNDYKGYDSALRVTTKTSGCSYHYEEFVRLFGEGYVDQVFRIAEKLKKLKLSRTVVMLMKVIAITSPDLDELKDKSGVETLHWLYVRCLLHELSKPTSNVRGIPSQNNSNLKRKMLTDIIEVLVQIRNLVYEYNKDSFVSLSSKEKILYSRNVLCRELRVSSPTTSQHTQWTHCTLDS